MASGLHQTGSPNTLLLSCMDRPLLQCCSVTAEECVALLKVLGVNWHPNVRDPFKCPG